jgi:hypothetical protein
MYYLGYLLVQYLLFASVYVSNISSPMSLYTFHYVIALVLLR